MLRRLWYWLRGPQPRWEGTSRQLSRSTQHAAGYDLYSFVPCTIPPHGHVLISTGLRTAFNPFWAAVIFDRSGYGAKGLHRFAGVIDSDYRGEWKIILYNTTDKPWEVKIGDRVAQVLFIPIWWGRWQLDGNLGETERGEGCCSSTGR